ncbi:hypothetical protein P43SY_005311 [Pythium insidiosum]|uniref:Cation-transporting P-type ATPase C-terminal domain-containing protein n=1 Tax=Pythium insidiosum TaxID=114742 RepID=A0AAD5LFW9_PYTIN|nr:hypothetical protein P43SY_005311 [Pythium insidiosum]KAJ0400147.1 hypothetical protein ATCC90586_007229 [Pythium insidiosum]
MDTFASLALATEEPTQALLERKPYPKTAPLLSKKMTKHILGQSILQLVILIVLTFWGDKIFNIPTGIYVKMENQEDADKKVPTQHMTIIFNTFVWLQLFNELNARKIHDEINIFSGITGNAVFLYVTVFQVAMQVVLVQFTGRVFNCKPLDLDQWLICIAIGALSLPWGLFLRSISVKNAPNWMAFCREADDVEVRQVMSGRGQELWLRGLARIRAQIRVIRAFKKGLQSRMLIKDGSVV